MSKLVATKIVATKVIAAPVDLVWGTFSDLVGRRSWLSDVESVELLTPGPLAIGTRWRETRTAAQGTAVTEELEVLAVETGRCCTIGLVGTNASPRLSYVLAPVAVGAHRGGTTVSVISQEPQSATDRRPQRLANRMLAFLISGFAARTVEGALRDELDALAAACARRQQTLPQQAA